MFFPPLFDRPAAVQNSQENASETAVLAGAMANPNTVSSPAANNAATLQNGQPNLSNLILPLMFDNQAAVQNSSHDSAKSTYLPMGEDLAAKENATANSETIPFAAASNVAAQNGQQGLLNLILPSMFDSQTATQNSQTNVSRIVSPNSSLTNAMDMVKKISTEKATGNNIQQIDSITDATKSKIFQNNAEDQLEGMVQIEQRDLNYGDDQLQVENHKKDDIIYSGGRITDIYGPRAEAFAEMYYEEIRHFSTDFIKIAKNTGTSEAQIRQIKAYLFDNQSLYDDDIGEWRRFDSDCAIAHSWQRLMIGTDIKPHDRTLINHEILEMQIKNENPMISHLEAHERASKMYNYTKEAEAYYDSLKSNQKESK